MPRPRAPPTPLSSTDIPAKHQHQSPDMEGPFKLPPPAVKSTTAKSAPKSRTQPTGTITIQTSPPSSPNDRMSSSSSQRKRTLSGGTKTRPESNAIVDSPIQSHDLPPPPSRARKIIQMKPKQSGTTQEETLSSSYSSKSTVVNTGSTSKRRSQPTTSSAAGRKIARKTAHSIIERRRRSKMNEEFGVLKDMIPACTGVEMHKLAILQAGIEYLKYLEGCVETLKVQNADLEAKNRVQQEEEEEEEEDQAESMEVDTTPADKSRQEFSRSTVSEEEPLTSDRSAQQSVSSQHPQNHRASSIATSTTHSSYSSPDLRPINSAGSVSQYNTLRLQSNSVYPQQRLPPFQTYNQNQIQSPSPTTVSSSNPFTTGVSPAFNAIQFSPDLSRSNSWSTIGRPSSNILPLPVAALPLLPLDSKTGIRDGQAEATATAALMMLTNDRRSGSGMIKAGSSKGISVKELLSS